MKKYNKYSGMFFDPEMDTSGGTGYALAHMDNPGGSEGTPPPNGGEGSGTGAGDAGAAGRTPGAGTTPTTPPPAAPPAFDANAFAKQFGDIVGQKLATHQQQQQSNKPPTPEELAAMQKELNFWEPADDWFTKYDNLETRKAAILEMRDGQFKQVMTVVNALLKDRDVANEGRWSPVQKMLEERANTERESRFDTKYPALADAGVKPMIHGLIAQLNSTGAFNGKSEEEAFGILASAAESVFKVHNPNFSLGAAPAGSSGSHRTSNAIPTTSSGSGGAGTGGGSAPAKSSNWALNHMK